MKRNAKLGFEPQALSIKSQPSAPKVLFIVGPTASGKSAVGLQVAQRLNGEIVCADSQTIRRKLSIGTAKPNSTERKKVPHHLIDIIEPYDTFNVAQFQLLAKKVIADVQSRGKVPIIVGGTGLYVDALFYDYTIGEHISTKHQDKLDDYTVESLQKMVTEAGYAMPVNSQNKRHLIGVLRRGGKTPEDKRPIPGAYIYGLKLADDELKKRIGFRVDAMFSEGFIDEVKEVIEIYGEPPQQFDAIGYTIAAEVLKGSMSEEEAKQQIVRATWQYARRQKSWFKRNLCIQWFETPDTATEYICKDMASLLNKPVTIDMKEGK